MHGSIFVIADNDALVRGAGYCPFDEPDMAAWIPGCDWVVREEEADFQESIALLNGLYDLRIQTTTIDLGFEQMKVGVLDKVVLEGLENALAQRKQERVKKVGIALQDPDPDMWEIAYDAYLYSGVYFVTVLKGGTSVSFRNEMDFYQSRPFRPEDAPLYITETYDFHV